MVGRGLPASSSSALDADGILAVKDKIECLEEAVITRLGGNRLGAGVSMERRHTEISPCVDLTVWASSEQGESMRNRELGSHLKHR